MVQTLQGIIVDVHERRQFPGTITIEDGHITRMTEDETVTSNRFLIPGFVDAHVHIESSLLVPAEFARLAMPHGTIATVSDPHEIANVCGMDGVRYMLDNGEQVPLTFAFGAPSCVPATTFETAGADITANDIRELFADERVRYLSEMMNWPGVLFNDPVVLEKLQVAREAGRPVDGHAPGLRGEQAQAYAQHGISTDHECFTLEEALDKIAAGMKILIREGSAARNYDALHPLLRMHPDRVMFCCDDAHPDYLLGGHIDRHVRASISHGYDLYDVLRAASVHPVEHYGLPVGLLRVGDRADFLVVDSLDEIHVLETWVGGQCVARRGESLFSRGSSTVLNRFVSSTLTPADLADGIEAGTPIRVIVAEDGQLVTSEHHGATSDPDVLKLVVVNRYAAATPAIAYIKGMGLTRGALASSVAHDSHNVIAVGTNDTDLAAAINAVMAQQGGLSVADGSDVHILPLPVAGLMSTEDAYVVAEKYTQLDAQAKACGSPLRAPFMTLSFMALLVIPSLKLSDQGLFNGQKFEFVSVTV